MLNFGGVIFWKLLWGFCSILGKGRAAFASGDMDQKDFKSNMWFPGVFCEVIGTVYTPEV